MSRRDTRRARDKRKGWINGSSMRSLTKIETTFRVLFASQRPSDTASSNNATEAAAVKNRGRRPILSSPPPSLMINSPILRDVEPRCSQCASSGRTIRRPTTAEMQAALLPGRGGNRNSFARDYVGLFAERQLTERTTHSLHFQVKSYKVTRYIRKKILRAFLTKIPLSVPVM